MNRILVVEDDEFHRDLLTQLLEDDYEILTAADGATCIEVAERERPDLILMDVVMPRMTGVEACKKLRAQAETRDIPIILVTTRGEPSSVELGFESGCNDYVTKPINSMELLGKVESLLEP